MSTSLEAFAGEIILNANLKAQPGKGDQVAELLAKIRDHSVSDGEPGCSTYRVARSGDTFAVWEKYTGQQAIKDHFNSAPFQALSAAGKDLLAEPPVILYYEEF